MLFIYSLEFVEISSLTKEELVIICLNRGYYNFKISYPFNFKSIQGESGHLQNNGNRLKNDKVGKNFNSNILNRLGSTIEREKKIGSRLFLYAMIFIQIVHACF